MLKQWSIEKMVLTIFIKSSNLKDIAWFDYTSSKMLNLNMAHDFNRGVVRISTIFILMFWEIAGQARNVVGGYGQEAGKVNIKYD